MIGCDHYGQYEYNNIKDYDKCCTCIHFCDNRYETRFECLSDVQDDNCYEDERDWVYIYRSKL